MSGFPQRRDHVSLEVRYVADDEARLSSFGDHACLAYRGRQYAALGALQSLLSTLVLDAHRRVTDAGEGHEALRMCRFHVRLCEGPPLEREVRSCAADDATAGPLLQRKAGVRARS